MDECDLLKYTLRSMETLRTKLISCVCVNLKKRQSGKCQKALTQPLHECRKRQYLIQQQAKKHQTYLKCGSIQIEDFHDTSSRPNWRH